MPLTELMGLAHKTPTTQKQSKNLRGKSYFLDLLKGAILDPVFLRKYYVIFAQLERLSNVIERYLNVMWT